ncbi:hypothetical protein D3C87_1317840 [compost metagenome]
MLFIPEHSRYFRVGSIDPGTDTLGTAVHDVDLFTGEVILRDATTLHGERNSRRYPGVAEVHGNRWAKLHSHEIEILHWLRYFQPNALICESPFLGRFPQAFEALVECKTAIRRALYQYDLTMPLETVDPPSAKIAVGAPGKSKKKEEVMRGILKLPNYRNESGKQIEFLDEHSTDAIAVGYYKCLTLINFVKGW